MAKASIDIPDALIEEAAKKRIKALEKEVKSLETKLVRRDLKLRQIEEVEQQEQRAVDAIDAFLYRIRDDAAFARHFNSYCDRCGW